MNKGQLVDAVAKEANLSKETAKKVVTAFIDTIKTVLADGDQVTLVGFGTFETTDMPERKGRNPQTGLPMQIKARCKPVFRPGKNLRESVFAAD